MPERRVDESGFVLNADEEIAPHESHPIVGGVRTPGGIPKDRCPDCGQFFPGSALSRHIQEFHTLKCSECGELVEKRKYGEHYGKCRRIPCRICGELVPFGHMTEHLHASHLITCKTCGAPVIADKLKKHRCKTHPPANKRVR